MRKLTAVEWLANELLYLDNEFDMKFIDKNEYQKQRKMIIDDAISLEELQIKDAYLKNHLQGCWMEKSAEEFAEEYYYETFKSE